MIINFTKRPVTIQAFRLTKETRWNNVDWPQWAHEAWNKEGEGSLSCQPTPDNENKSTEHLFIGTLEGVMRVDIGDWIIRGIKGELYPCKPDIFIETYTPEGGTWCENCKKPVQILGQDYFTDDEGTDLCIECWKDLEREAADDELRAKHEEHPESE
jgi:hypothetical protein